MSMAVVIAGRKALNIFLMSFFNGFKIDFKAILVTLCHAKIGQITRLRGC